MKSISVAFLIAGLVLLIIGYYENKQNCPTRKIEYRYVPRQFYDEQMSQSNLKNVYSDMFDKASDYWKNAIRLAPNNYIEAQNWLKITGKLTDNLS